MFHSMYFKKIQEEETKRTGTYSEVIGYPEADNVTQSECCLLDPETGIAREGSKVTKGQILVGKTRYLQQPNGKPIKKDYSLRLSSNEDCYVDKVYISLNDEGGKVVKIRLRKHRIPEIGDKFASLAAQKGTTGQLLEQQDMPFTTGGITVDFIINSHAFPSRMTTSQLIECIIGKKVCVSGESIKPVATAFQDRKIDEIGNELVKHGFNRYGYERMINGMTGELMEGWVFIGPTYYQRLKHMVSDKYHCLTLDHEVLTIDGWKTYHQLSKNDKIATLKDGNLVYENPTDIHYYENYEGKLYSISNSSIDLRVTEGHRMWVSKCYERKRIWQPYKFVEAKDLVNKSVKYLKNCDWICNDYQFILPVCNVHNGYEYIAKQEIIVDMNSWITFFGIWIAEGWTYQGTTSYKIQISVNKQRVKNALYPAIKKLGYNYNVSNEKLEISNQQLWNYMKQFSLGAPNKYLPDWVFKLSKTQTQLLIESMILGDGTYNKNASGYYTTSVKLADQFMQLCLHAGWSSTKHLHFEKGHTSYYEGRKIESNYDLWKLSVIKSKNNPEVNHTHSKEQNIQIETYEEWKGEVFCVSVPSEIFYVRRNGKCVWTGNSRGRGPTQPLNRQPLEGRARQGGLRVGEMESNCLISHGVSAVVKERLMEVSDKYKTTVCDNCGFIVKTKDGNCPRCKTSRLITTIMPYSFKLLCQELQGFLIAPRIKFN